MTEREVVQRILAVTVAVSFTIQGVAQETTLNERVSDRLENPLMSGSWDTSPYRVQLFLSFGRTLKQSSVFCDRLTRKVKALIDRDVSRQWQCNVTQLQTDRVNLFSHTTHPEKVHIGVDFDTMHEIQMVVRIEKTNGARWQLQARERNQVEKKWGPVETIEVSKKYTLDRAIVNLCLQTFSPMAVPVSPPESGIIRLSLRAGKLRSFDPDVQWVRKGDVFRVTRLFTRAGNRVVEPVSWTYWKVQQVEMGIAHCRQFSPYRNLNTQRAVGSQLIGWLVRGRHRKTELRFVQPKNAMPLMGFTVHVSDAEQRKLLSRVVTDRKGKIVLEGDASRLLRLDLPGLDQRGRSIWILTGEERSRDVPLDLESAGADLVNQIRVLEETLLDQVARRTLTLRQVQLRMDQEKWQEAEKLLGALDGSNRMMSDRIDKLKQDVERFSGASNLQVERRTTEMENLMNRFLDPKTVRDVESELRRRRSLSSNQSGSS